MYDDPWDFEVVEKLKRTGDPFLMKGYCKYFKKLEYRKSYFEAVKMMKRIKNEE